MTVSSGMEFWLHLAALRKISQACNYSCVVSGVVKCNIACTVLPACKGSKLFSLLIVLCSCTRSAVEVERHSGFAEWGHMEMEQNVDHNVRVMSELNESNFEYSGLKKTLAFPM